MSKSCVQPEPAGAPPHRADGHSCVIRREAGRFGLLAFRSVHVSTFVDVARAPIAAGDAARPTSRRPHAFGRVRRVTTRSVRVMECTSSALMPGRPGATHSPMLQVRECGHSRSQSDRTHTLPGRTTRPEGCPRPPGRCSGFVLILEHFSAAGRRLRSCGLGQGGRHSEVVARVHRGDCLLVVGCA